MTDRFYYSKIISKTSIEIPAFENGQTFESKYNPQREAETLLTTIEKEYSFFLVCGIGSGTFIKELSLQFPKAKIIAVENSVSDINFISEFPSFISIKNNPQITIISKEDCKKTLIQNYLPAIYPDAKIIFQRNWALHNEETFNYLKEEITQALEEIKYDFSVQSQFGKLWQDNIIKNLLIFNTLPCSRKLSLDLTKTALVVAAGPSLDKFVQQINKNRENYYIIATDTASRSLTQNNIVSDLIVSIDGQFLSYNHFFNNDYKNTAFLFDLCANSSIVEKLKKYSDKIFFFSNSHPLSEYFRKRTNGIQNIYTGSGTVTIAALDFALKAGFKNIEVCGADFSYINNKAYTKGTYLDFLYYKNSCKIHNAEYSFNKLMFRTELEKISDKACTSSVLKEYKKSFENYLDLCNCTFTHDKDLYIINNNMQKPEKSENKNCISIQEAYKDLIENAHNYEEVFLPYIAWLRNQKDYKELSFDKLFFLAHRAFVSYNILI